MQLFELFHRTLEKVLALDVAIECFCAVQSNVPCVVERLHNESRSTEMQSILKLHENCYVSCITLEPQFASQIISVQSLSRLCLLQSQQLYNGKSV